MFDFPNSPTNGQTVTGPGGIVYQWNTVKWVAAPNTNAWAPTNSPTFTGNPTAPTPPQGDASQSVATTAFVTPLTHNVGRNLLHNGLFNIAQRGAGPWTTPGTYTADRWNGDYNSDTVSWTIQPLADADRAAIGDEAASYSLHNAFTGSAAASSYTILLQRIENGRRLSGKTVTFSFWAKAVAGTPKLGFNVYVSYGTGGSPSAASWVLATGNVVTISTTWARYSTTIAIPSASGKTFGTNGDSYVQPTLWLSCGTGQSATSGNIGVQSGTFDFWGIQLEIGSVATPLEKLDPRLDLANCQRFFTTYVNHSWWYYTNIVGSSPYYTMFLPVRLRATPTVTFTPYYTNGTNGRLMGATMDLVLLTADAVAAGWVMLGVNNLQVSADL